MTLCQHCVNKDARNSQRKVPKLRSKYPVGWIILCLGALATRYDCLVPLLALLQLTQRFYKSVKGIKCNCVLAVNSVP